MIDFEKRLKSLKERRQGSRERAIFDSMDSLAANSAILRGIDIRNPENFEKLKEPAGVKYAVGAMAAVDGISTQVSINEGNRVADSLIKSLAGKGESVTKRLQGSVALDIHIKGHSDVDMLIIVTNPVIVELPKVSPAAYIPTTDTRSCVDIARDVRNKSEKSLSESYYTASVNCAGDKSIAIEGGSLKRKVDIVPAIWYDTIVYQNSDQEHDRGIKIYHKSNHELLLNYPFKHIKLINDRDLVYTGNLKSVIRLIKNMIADMPDYKKSKVKKLSSYDIAAIAYHMNEQLSVPAYFKLALVEKTRAHLQLLCDYPVYRETLSVPDGSRKIFDTPEKTEALSILCVEFTDLATSIFKELSPYINQYNPQTILNKVVI